MPTGAAAVNAYFDGLPETARGPLERVRAIIHEELPGAEERISYGMPAFRRGERDVVYCAAWKKHFSLYPAPEEIVKELPASRVSKGTVRFSYAGPLEEDLIRRMVRILAKKADA